MSEKSILELTRDYLRQSAKNARVLGDPFHVRFDMMADTIDDALTATAEPSIPVSKVREMIVRAVDWGYDEGFARANDEGASAVPIDDKCDRILAEYAGAGK